MTKLGQKQLQTALRKLQFNWQLTSEWLVIEFAVKDFDEAVWVLNQVAEIAAALNHHPDIAIKSFNQVRIATTSHDVQGLTNRDLALAERVDAIITRINRAPT